MLTRYCIVLYQDAKKENFFQRIDELLQLIRIVRIACSIRAMCWRMRVLPCSRRDDLAPRAFVSAASCRSPDAVCVDSFAYGFSRRVYVTHTTNRRAKPLRRTTLTQTPDTHTRRGETYCRDPPLFLHIYIWSIRNLLHSATQVPHAPRTH